MLLYLLVLVVLVYPVHNQSNNGKDEIMNYAAIENPFRMQKINLGRHHSSHCRHAETPECWSLEFQLDATFADNVGHICRQIMYICRQFYHMTKNRYKIKSSWNFSFPWFLHAGLTV